MDESKADIAALEAEETLPMSKVNSLIKREKESAAERVRREMQEQHAAELAKLQASQAQQPGVDIDKVYSEVESRLMKQIADRQQKMQQEADREEFKKLAANYHVGTERGKESYEDWDAVTSDFDPNEFPELALMIGKFDNVADIVYDLNKRPNTLANIHAVLKDSPSMANKMLKQVSDSIKENQKAKQQHVTAPAPLSRTKSSTVGADNRKMTLADLKKQPWLKA